MNNLITAAITDARNSIQEGILWNRPEIEAMFSGTESGMFRENMPVGKGMTLAVTVAVSRGNVTSITTSVAKDGRLMVAVTVDYLKEEVSTVTA